MSNLQKILLIIIASGIIFFGYHGYEYYQFYKFKNSKKQIEVTLLVTK